MDDIIKTFAPSTRRLVSILQYKLKHSTTDNYEKDKINKYINNIIHRSIEILKDSPDDIMKPLTFKKKDHSYFVSILTLYLDEKWSTVNLDNGIEVDCMNEFIYVYSALKDYYEKLI